MASISTRTGVLGKRLAAHLLRRSTYHYNRERVDTFAQMTATQAVEDLLKPMPTPTVSTPPTLDKSTISTWWMHQALLDPTIHHRMAFFLHTLYVVDFMSSEEFNYQHLRLLNLCATGNLKAFSKKMSVDNRMVRYLDGNSSSSGNPNENYAREYLELFSVGKGPQLGPGNYTNYTEHDVQQAARIFTGFRIDKGLTHIDPDTGIPRAKTVLRRHDTGDKTFSSAFQGQTISGRSDQEGMYQEISDFVDMVYGQLETAKFACRKLYRYFVRPHIDEETESGVIAPLAQILYDNDYELKPVLTHLLTSVHFFDEDDGEASDEIIGTIFKSPLELLLSSLSFFKIPIPDPELEADNHYKTFYHQAVQRVFFGSANFFLFLPPSVAGYPAYYQQPEYFRKWFSSNSIASRYKLPEMLLTGKRVLKSGGLGGVILDSVSFVANPSHITDPQDATTIVKELLEYLLPEEPDPDRFDYFLNGVFLNGLSPKNWKFEWQNFLSTGDASDVKIPLDRLIKGIMHSPEFQLL